MYPLNFQKLIAAFRKLPQVGNKAAERYAYALLEMSDEDVFTLLTTIKKAKENTRHCQQCFHLSEEDYCDICLDNKRDFSIVCVVNSSRDIIAMENTKQYNGLYHVLKGEISPTKGVMPEDLTISELMQRLDNGVVEVIIATNSTVDGETTALYLSKLIKNKNIIVSRLAHGIPMGGQLDYADELTLTKAIEGRVKY